MIKKIMTKKINSLKSLKLQLIGQLKNICKILTVLCLAMALPCYAGDGYNNAKHAVLNQPCLGNESVNQLLDHKHRNLHTDLGWRLFAMDNGVYLVERVFMVSKFTEMTYRWRITGTEAPQASNERAKALCNTSLSIEH